MGELRTCKRKRAKRKGGKSKKGVLQKTILDYDKSSFTYSQKDICVSDYLDYWLKEYVIINCKYSTIEGYKIIIERHIKPDIGHYKLHSIQAIILQQFINKKYMSGLGKHYLANILSVLSCAFKHAVYPYQFIKENPTQYIKLPKYKQQKELSKKILTSEDFKRIITRFPEGSSFYIPLQIAYHTGARISECCALTWDDVDFKNQTISINKIIQKQENREWYFSTPKTHTSNRNILIGNTLIGILKKHYTAQRKNKKAFDIKYLTYYKNSQNKIYTYPQGSSYTPYDDMVNFICTSAKGSLISPESFRYCSRIINYELMIPFRFHNLRHTHATLLIENGAKIKDVQNRLGHSRIATTMDIYSHATSKMSHETVEIFEKSIK